MIAIETTSVLSSVWRGAENGEDASGIAHHYGMPSVMKPYAILPGQMSGSMELQSRSDIAIGRTSKGRQSEQETGWPSLALHRALLLPCKHIYYNTIPR